MSECHRGTNEQRAETIGARDYATFTSEGAGLFGEFCRFCNGLAVMTIPSQARDVATELQHHHRRGQRNHVCNSYSNTCDAAPARPGRVAIANYSREGDFAVLIWI